jgi:transposase
VATQKIRRRILYWPPLKEIGAERDAIALTENVSAHTNAKKIQNLVKLKAIGAEIATVLTGEVFYRPFNNRLQVASYVALTPSPFQSGSKCRDQGISKAGNPKSPSGEFRLDCIVF